MAGTPIEKIVATIEEVERLHAQVADLVTVVERIVERLMTLENRSPPKRRRSV